MDALSTQRACDEDAGSQRYSRGSGSGLSPQRQSALRSPVRQAQDQHGHSERGEQAARTLSHPRGGSSSSSISSSDRCSSLEALDCELDSGPSRLLSDRASHGIFLVLGIGILSPWNVLVAATSYLQSVHPGKPVEFAVAVFYFWPLFLSAAVIFLLQLRPGLLSSIAGGFVLFGIILMLLPVGAARSMFVLLLLVTVLSIADAFAQGALWAAAGIYGDDDFAPASALNVGMGIAGVLVLLVQALLSTSTKEVTTDSGGGGSVKAILVFFWSAAFFSFACAALFAYLRTQNLPFIRALQASRYSRQIDKAQAGERQSISYDDQREQVQGRLSISGISVVSRIRASWQLFLLMLPDAATVFSVFFVTLSLFPGVLVRCLQRAPERNLTLCFHHGKAWCAMTPGSATFVLILTFAVFDLVGKLLASPAVRLVSSRATLACALSRLGFVPLFALLFVHAGTMMTSALRVVSFLVMVALFAVSNGLLAGVAMLQGPKQVESDQRELAGFVMSFALMAGLACGSALGLAVASALMKET
ncbi:Equilibrative nucleotide transporter 1 [Porphyridium purpureum]|uniref:Equilibrative nucleotide transporter 1 n=1 Tax=Porphyridium purpureum TaxID=35688 RepID=A0A5J4Z7H1_PORPP|nr:Equilibrative nucleotide transporter 1 [Porphyridium purpureum]|eukprot:POR8982..scf295_1